MRVKAGPGWVQNAASCSSGLTWTVPLRAALVSVHQYGKTQQAAVGGVGGKGATLGLVKEHQLVVDADVLGAFIHDLCIRRLVGGGDTEMRNQQHNL